MESISCSKKLLLFIMEKKSHEIHIKSFTVLTSW